MCMCKCLVVFVCVRALVYDNVRRTVELFVGSNGIKYT